jgi:hypothetical protein
LAGESGRTGRLVSEAPPYVGRRASFIDETESLEDADEIPIVAALETHRLKVLLRDL